QCNSDYSNSPPYLNVNGDRVWTLSESTSVNTTLGRASGEDNENDPLTYGIESKEPGKHIPFGIDPENGFIYLNESLEGKNGTTYNFYITANDGKVTSKFEMYAEVKNNANKLFSSFLRPPKLPPPPLVSPVLYDTTPLTEKVYPKKENITTYLTTAPPFDKRFNYSPQPTSEAKPLETVTAASSETPVDQRIKQAPDLTMTLVPVLSVFAIFLAVGFIALMFRKKIYLGRSKDVKEDMRKESSPNVVLHEDPGLDMQQWRGPRAFSNRYEPWDREQQPHQQAVNQSSTLKEDNWEFARHRLKFFNILGEGAFGQVWKCEALDIDGKEGGHVVAVKTLKENATEKERVDLISELQVMKMLEPHPNVVRLLGCCTEKDPIFVIMEFVSRGKLQSYLRNSRAERFYNNMHGQSKSLTSRDLTSFVYQVAKGMEYLSANGIIHRDLAARNILITEDHTCKVADFGFARDVIASYIYERKSEGRLPIRWMAPESLYDNIFSIKSDVWSFGVLMWEVVTLGSTPYPGLSAAEVMRKVRDGHRLDKPEHCRRELYNIMYYCWDKDPKQRPTFTECVQLLEKLLMTETDYIELERFPDHSYYNMMSISGEKL
ncbi:Protein tyrosine and serine/threonine kinase, partial [Popillia japonica]